VPGPAVNRHCAGSLTAVGNAAAFVFDEPGSVDTVDGARPTFPCYTDETYGLLAE
jgi:hypothetical protein